MSGRRRYLVAGGLVAAIALVWMLSLHRSYSPGPVSHGHRKFEAQCAACHEPWHGATNAGCLDCHGDMSSNKHAGTKLADKDSGLMPGIHLAGLKGELACLSCHTDHRGRVPDFEADGWAHVRRMPSASVDCRGQQA